MPPLSMGYINSVMREGLSNQVSSLGVCYWYVKTPVSSVSLSDLWAVQVRVSWWRWDGSPRRRCPWGRARSRYTWEYHVRWQRCGPPGHRPRPCGEWTSWWYGLGGNRMTSWHRHAVHITDPLCGEYRSSMDSPYKGAEMQIIEF